MEWIIIPQKNNKMVLKIETKLHELAGLIIDLNSIQNFWQIIKIRISA